MTTGGSTFWTSGSVPLIAPEFLSSIIGAASDIALVVSAEGVILSVVLNEGQSHFGDLSHWEGRPIVDFLTDESIAKFDVAHAAHLAGNAPAAPLELNHCDATKWQHPVRYSFHRFGQENAALLLGRDLRPIAETQQQLVQAQIALEQGYEARREFDARYRVLMAQSSDAVLFVNAQTGHVEDCNPEVARLLGADTNALNGALLSSVMAHASGDDLIEALTNATLSDAAKDVPVKVLRSGDAVSVFPTVFRARGQRMLLCRVQGGSASAPSTDADGAAAALFRDTTDAICFMDVNGVVTSVNEGFMDLVEVSHLSDVVGKSLSDHLSRGQIDLSVLIENAARESQMRVFATKMRTRMGTDVPVEISTTRIADDAHPGIGLILRDASRVDTMRATQRDAKSPQHRDVAELVGSASLKEIVAETTDVVEKMCIETAVALTKNNRVAAAEMLGLSRQSLYVKLRKFGLLSKG